MASENAMHLRQHLEKAAIARHGERDAGSRHRIAVEAHQHRNHHANRHNAGAPAAKHKRHCGRCRLWRTGDGAGRHDKLQRGVHGDVQHGNGGDAECESDRQAAPRISNFSGNGGHQVPAVVGPQRCHEAGKSASRIRRWRGEVVPATAAVAESRHHDRHNNDALLRASSWAAFAAAAISSFAFSSVFFN
jgi:hypothetical protein